MFSKSILCFYAYRIDFDIYNCKAGARVTQQCVRLVLNSRGSSLCRGRTSLLVTSRRQTLRPTHNQFSACKEIAPGVKLSEGETD